MPSVTSLALKSLALDTHELADFAELRAALDADASYSRSELVDDLKGADQVAGEEVGNEVIDEADEENGENGDDEERPAEGSRGDVLMRTADDVFAHLRYRVSSLGESYPFAVEDGPVLVRAATVGDRRKFYLFLLIASLLARVDKSSRQHAARHFEVLSARLLKVLLGWRGEVAVFGTTSKLAESEFKGRLWTKIQQLATKLGEQVKIPEREVPKKDNGDNGLDIVAHLGFGDSATGRLVLFGQCACTSDWNTKQHSACEDAWAPVVSLSQPIVPITFIPFFFRDATGGWARTRDVHRTVVLDRLRLVKAYEAGGVELPEQVTKMLTDLLQVA
jgi:hypothetical protein